MDVTMPQLGETVTEGTITRWFKQPGDAVAADEPLFEVSTDKVDSEVPSPGAGVLTEILVPEGETVEVGVRLAVLGEGDGSARDGRAPDADGADADGADEHDADADDADEDGGDEVGEGDAEDDRADEPADEPTSEPAPQPQAPRDGQERAQRPPRREAREAPEPAAPGSRDGARAAASSAGSSAVRSPIVRRLLAEHDLDPSDLEGTGEGGRITRRDVLEAAKRDRAAPSRPRAEKAPPSREAAPARPRGGERIPFDNIRRRTAEHVVASKATSAHVYTSVEVDFERVERARRAHGDAWREQEGFSLTYLPFITRAVCDAIVDWPKVNASVDGDALVVHHEVHLGIAVDLDFEGLIAPVIRDADGKRLWLLAREIRDLADRARSRRLSPDEVLGGTFTITNPGPFASYMTLPIINQPQVAILATDGIAKRPVVVEGPDGEDTIAIHHTGMLALAWDHRAFDGAYASSFLRAVKDIIEQRDWLPELA